MSLTQAQKIVLEPFRSLYLLVIFVRSACYGENSYQAVILIELVGTVSLTMRRRQ
jgi:hypothetical protein